MKPSAETIDAVLPQTQCGLCGFGACMPYAKALANQQAAINLCPPGGLDSLFALGKLLNVDPAPFITAMQQHAKPPVVAQIREAECIGCTKCIQACPVDAIVGSAKQMHTILVDQCTGCELCVAPCPVDCIDLHSRALGDKNTEKNKADHARTRFHARQQRLAQKMTPDKQAHPPNLPTTTTAKKSYIADALLRASLKKKFR